MQEKLTITYEGLHAVIGRRRVGRLIEDLVRPYMISHELEAAHAQIAQDEKREAETLEQTEVTVEDMGDEAR